MKVQSIILCLLIICEAHVRLVYTDNEFELGSRPIRNAPSANADGVASVAGPCGGTQAWGANGASAIEPGDQITIKFNYGADHDSPQNLLTVRFLCGTSGNGPTETQMESSSLDQDGTVCQSLRCPTDNYPCPAPDAQITNGYVFRCTVPSNAAGKDCTYSVVDQRDWGGCLDLAVSQTVDGEPIYPLEQHVGSYEWQNNEADVFMESSFYATSSCCCAMNSGTLSVTQPNSGDDQTAHLSGTMSFQCPDFEAFTSAGLTEYSHTLENLVLTKDTSATSLVWRGRSSPNGYLTEYVLTDKTVYWNYVDDRQQLICDGKMPMDGTPGTGIAFQCPQGSNLSEASASVGAFPFIIVAAVVGTAAVCFKSMQSKKQQQEKGLSVV